MARLETYHARRNFTRTREPKGRADAAGDGRGGLFVIHKHAARRLHYDLRLEFGGVLWSWAVTRGPTLDPGEKRLAVHVEDHPLDYADFEGTIPAGEYGGGTVLLWDRGIWKPEGDAAKGMAKGHLEFTLSGEKLAGRWHLVRLKGRRGEKRDNWLLIKAQDAAARETGDILEEAPLSVASGRSMEAIAAGEAAKPRKPRRGSARAKPAAVFPTFVEPALAQLQSTPPTGDGWVHEVKFDGYRLQARLAGGKVAFLTRKGLDWTERFGSRLAEAFAALPCDSAVIDGEIVTLRDGGASFSALQNALSEGQTQALLFYAFDLLMLDGEDLRGLPLLERKTRLDALLPEDDGPLRLSEHFSDPGGIMLREACRMGLEGVVSKRVDAPYRSGRTGDWVKSKCTNRQEFVITGYVPSAGSGRELGSLVVGLHRGGAWVPAGRVGTGFGRMEAKRLKDRLDALLTERSPYSGKAGSERGIRWVKPELVAEVEFRSITDAGLLRHAAYLGLREDKSANEVEGEGAIARAEPETAKAQTTIRLSSADKVLWPEPGITKAELLDYYASIWDRIRPHVVERPLSLLRAPDGIGGQTFFQKHASAGMPDTIHRMRDRDSKELLFIRDFDGLATLVQFGTVEIHVWGARIDAIETPDMLVFDLDPSEGISGNVLRDAALLLRDRLADLGLRCWAKTSGGKGYHLVAPVIPSADWARVKTFCRDFAQACAAGNPELFTATMSMKARKGKIFLDYLRNGRGATAVAAYSSRARDLGTIAAPVRWEDIEKGVTPHAYTIRQPSAVAQDESQTIIATRAIA
ncbi:MAG: DNA ligase D [Methylobacterium sp.]|nr:MAG: DNA ligase D [Methylobacterium sp.]